ncbi:MAG: hypothetical protein CEE38_03330 [Planctomycetes bacterium B3_Pla]|nr:MAG: hypothetical protein CEE38_03330 [Planctomycetes bacterium B3_Pla]
MGRPKSNDLKDSASGASQQMKKGATIVVCVCLTLLTHGHFCKGESMSKNGPNLIELAKQKFGTLTEAEEKLFQAFANGQLADFSAKDATNNNPADANNWGPERTIKSEHIAWLCRDDHASELVAHNGIWVKGARVDRRIQLNGAHISFLLFFDKCALPEGISVVNAELFCLSLPGTHTGPITADGAKVEGSVFLEKGFKAKGEVRLLGATVGGQLSCIDGHFINPDGPDGPEGHALNADGLTVEGSVFLRDGFRSEGKVNLAGASIRSNLECNKGQFINSDGYALAADRLKVGGSVLLGNGFRSEGKVLLVGATIGRTLDCRKGQFINPDGYALSANGMKVEGNVLLRDGFKAEGEVRLLGATIGGNLDCDKSQFINPDGCALAADRSKVDGSVFLREANAKGEVCLLGGTIDRNLECNRGQFINPDGHALCAAGLTVEGNVFLGDGFNANGKVDFVDATVQGYFVWTGVDSPEKVELDLRSARIGTIQDDEQSWPDSGKLFLGGLIYDEIADGAPNDAKTRIEWLQRQYDEQAQSDKEQFRPQPYEQLAAVFRKSGRDEDAKKILIEKNKDKARLTKLMLSERSLHYLSGLIIGYGYRPWRTVRYGLVIVLFGWFLFWAGYRADVMTLANEGEDASGGFSAFIYSLDVFVPLVDLRQASYWLPNANHAGKVRILDKFNIPVSGRCLRIWFCFEIFAGWGLTTLFVVGVTGLVRT